MSSTLLSRLSAILGFTTIEEGVSEEIIRNMKGRAQLAELECTVQEEKRANQQKIDAEAKIVENKQKGYAEELKPLLTEFDSLSMAEHFYDTSVHSMENEAYLADALLKKEGEHYGYLGKKLASVSLHLEFLRQEIESGRPFQEALQGLLKDAEDEDLRVVAGPLQRFAPTGKPSDLNVRHAAFSLSQVISKAGSATSVEEPVNKWVNIFRFRTTVSPSKEEANCVQARKDARELMEHIRHREYAKGLEVVQRAKKELEARRDPVLEEFKDMEAKFRQQVDPIVAADVFLMYSSSWLTCTRFASVEKVIS